MEVEEEHQTTHYYFSIRDDPIFSLEFFQYAGEIADPAELHTFNTSSRHRQLNCSYSCDSPVHALTSIVHIISKNACCGWLFPEEKAPNFGVCVLGSATPPASGNVTK